MCCVRLCDGINRDVRYTVMILFVIYQLMCVTNPWAHMSFMHSILSLKLGVTVPSTQESDKAKWDQAANKMGGNQVNEEIVDQNSQPEVNQGPELCAPQVEDQSFFFIEECIDPRVSKEKECIGVINVLQGHATAKQIEQQFMHLVGSNS